MSYLLHKHLPHTLLLRLHLTEMLLTLLFISLLETVCFVCGACVCVCVCVCMCCVCVCACVRVCVRVCVHVCMMCVRKGEDRSTH